MKLARANERAAFAGKDALIQRGAVIKSGRTKYRVLQVRGSTVTVEVLTPWYKTAAAWCARRAAAVTRRLRLPRPVRSAK